MTIKARRAEMAYIVETDELNPEEVKQFSFAQRNDALKKARQLALEEVNRVFVLYQRKDGSYSDGHYVFHPMDGSSDYECC